MKQGLTVVLRYPHIHSDGDVEGHRENEGYFHDDASEGSDEHEVEGGEDHRSRGDQK